MRPLGKSSCFAASTLQFLANPLNEFLQALDGAPLPSNSQCCTDALLFVGPVTDCVAALKEIIAALFIRGSGIEIDGLLKHFHHTFQGVEQEDADAFYLAILHRLEVSL